MLKNLLVSLCCLLSLARPFGFAYGLPSTSANSNYLRTEVPPDRQRYMGIVVYNFEDTPGFGLDRIENSARNGCNMVEICVHWDKVYPTRNGPAKWTNLDLQVQKALEFNMKVGIRITTARDANLLNGFWSEQETMMASDMQRLTGATGVHFSFAHQPTLDLAKDFVRQVTEHFQYLQQQNKLLFMSVAGSGALECEYAPSNTSRPSGMMYGTTFDYSDPMRQAFRQWLQSRFSLATLNSRWGSDFVSWDAVQPSGFGSSSPWGAFAGKRGEDWFVFRHRMLKRYIDQTIQTIKNVNGAIKIVNQHGSAWDQLSGRRGTLAFKNLAQNADGVKLNDGPEYNHRWSMDVVRSNIREGGYASNEVDGLFDWASAEEHVEQVQTSFLHGAKFIIYANFNSPQQLYKLNRILEIVKGQGWLNQPVPVIQPQASMGYKLSDVLRSDFTYDPIFPRWNQLYTQTNQPVKVLLDEDLLDDTNQDPRVAQPIPDQTASVGQPFNFTIPSGTFTDPDGSITQVLITAGLPANGLSANGTTISGTPTSAGNLQITVQATDNLGAFTSTQFRINITGGSSGNQPPVVSQAIPAQSATVGQAYSYTIPSNTFSDPNGSIASVQVTSGLPAGLSYNSGNRTISGTPTTAGTATVNVQATDNQGATVSTSFTFTVNSSSGTGQFTMIAPIYDCVSGRIEFRTTGGNGSTIQYQAIGVTDWTTNPIQFVDLVQRQNTLIVLNARQSGQTVSYSFTTSCQGSSTNQPPVVSQAIPAQSATAGQTYTYTIPSNTFSDPDGSIASVQVTSGLPAGLSYNASNRTIGGVPASAGTSTVSVQATDNQGATVTTQFQFTVNNSSPTNQSPVVSQSIPAQNGVVGQAYSYTIPSNTFSDPDGSIASVQVTGGLPIGLSYNASNRTISGTPTTAGTSTVSVQATDNQGATVTTQFQFTVSTSPTTNPPTNQPPVVSQAIPSQNGVVGQAYSYTIPSNTFSDPDGSIASVQVTGGLPQGLSYNAGNRTISGTPTTVGQSTVNVQATDNQGASVSTSFAFAVSNQAVTPRYEGHVDNAECDLLRGWAADRNRLNQPISIDVYIDGALALTTVAEVLRPDLGVYLGDNGRHGFAFSPPQAYRTAGSHTLRVTFAGTNQELFNQFGRYTCPVTSTPPTNQSPVVSQVIPTQSATVGQAYNYTIPSNTFSDPDGSIVSVQVTGGLPAGLSYNAGNRTISGTPTTAGTSTVNVQATDNQGATVTTQFQFTVSTAPTTNPPTNQSPVVSQVIPTQSATVGQAYSYTIPSNTFSDPDGNIASVQVTSGLPAGLSYNANNRTISGTPTTAGTSTVTVRATDNQGATVTTQFQFTVNNSVGTGQPITVNPIPNQTIYQGYTYSQQLPANIFVSSNPQPVQITVSGLPAGLSYNPSTRTISGTPITVGVSTVTLTGVDGNQVTATTSFQLTVAQAPTPQLTLAIIGAGPNGQVLQNLQPGMVIRMNTMPSFVNIACISTVPVGSIYLEMLGQQSANQTDNEAPYTLFSESGFRPQSGFYFIRATAYSGPNGTGRALATESMIIGFTLTGGGRLSADPTPQETAQPWVVAPNPVQDVINVSLPANTPTENLTFEIISQNSQQNAVAGNSVRLEEGKASIDIRSLQLARGIYYLKVSAGSTILKTVKILKE